MKFLIILMTFYFIGCGSDSDKKQSEQNPNAEEESSSTSPFTITHNTTNSQFVFIYLSEEKEDDSTLKEFPPLYRLQPSECVQVTKSQFPNLKVQIGRGQSRTFACGSSSNLCQTGHYEIINASTSWYGDNYILQPVAKPNTNEKCIAIEKWMENKKNPKPKEPPVKEEDRVLVHPSALPIQNTPLI